MGIPTEPIGSIPRPLDLIDAVERGEIDDPTTHPMYEAATRDAIEHFEATGSPVITDGEQRKYANFWTYSVHGLPNTAPDGFGIPFSAGHTRRMPRLTSGPFRYMRYADSYLEIASRYATRPLKQAVISPSERQRIDHRPSGRVWSYRDITERARAPRVLTHAKLETGTIHFDVTDVHVADAFAAAEAIIAPQAWAKNMTLTVTPAAPGLVLHADAEKVQQILANLLSNAVKFSDADGRIELAAAGPRSRSVCRRREARGAPVRLVHPSTPLSQDRLMLFESWTALLRVLVVGSAAYVALVILLRISGKRTLSKMNAFDFVVTVAMGSILATVLLSPDVALAEGVFALMLLVGLQYAITWTSVRSERVRDLVKSRPTLLYYRGEFFHGALRRERVTEEEVLAAIRSQGPGRLDAVTAVVLETDGTISAIAEEEGEPDTLLRGVRRSGPG